MINRIRDWLTEWLDGLDGKTWGLIPMAIIWALFWWVPERKTQGEARDDEN